MDLLSWFRLPAWLVSLRSSILSRRAFSEVPLSIVRLFGPLLTASFVDAHFIVACMR